MHFACGTLLDGTVQRCLDVGTPSQQASLGNAAEKWSTSCIAAQASKSAWFEQRYRPFYCLIGWKTRTSCLSMSIGEGSWVAPWGKWHNELCRRAEEVDTSESSLRHLVQLPVALSRLRLAS